MDGNNDGLLVIEALKRSPSIATSIPTTEITNAVRAGTIVVVKGAFDCDEMKRLRAAVMSAAICYGNPGFDATASWRQRHEEYRGAQRFRFLECSFIAVFNPDDRIGQALHKTGDRLAAYWRALTGCVNTFAPAPDRQALRLWAMNYPAGGGCFEWHQHHLEPTRIGVILALSQIGSDFQSGGNEFRSPYGLVNTIAHHDIGDICLFRYDLPHRVAPVDPHRELRWDGTGRWTLLIQGDPRSVEGP